jgi:outer membrane receptor protein involved in Fe transport
MKNPSCRVLPAFLLLAALAAAAGTNPPPSSLPPVVVTAGRLGLPLTNLPASAQTVARPDIEASGATSLDGALDRIVGAERESYGLPGAGVKFDLRGLAWDYQSKSALVLMDGRRVNEAFQGNVEFAQLPPGNVEQVTVIRGPGSCAYGSGALGGVVDVRMRSGLGIEPFAEVSAAGGNYATFAGRAAGGGQFGPFDLYAGAGHVRTGGYRPVAGGSEVEWDAEDFFANLGWTAGPNDLFRVQGGYYTGEGTDREGPRTVERSFGNGAWRHRWDSGRGEELTVRAYDTYEHSVYDVMALDPVLVRDYRLRTTGGEVQETLRPRDGLRLAFGGDLRRDAADNEDFGRLDRSEWAAGLFAEGDLDLTDRLVLSLGARFDKHEEFAGRVSPRAALLCRVLPGMEWYASAATAYRTPGLSDRYIRTLFDAGGFPLPIVGNPGLKPTILTAYETGVRQHLGRDAGWSLALFRNDIRDRFDFVFDPTVPPFGGLTQANASRAYTQGVEAEGHAGLGAGFGVFADLALTQGRITAAADPSVRGRPINNLAPVKAGAGIAWHTDRQRHGLAVRYEGERYADAANTRELDAHAVLDWTSRVAVAPHLTLTLNVWNLLDESYRVYDLTAPGSSIRAAGRRLLLGAEAKF